MVKSTRKRKKKIVGAAPGTLLYTGEATGEAVMLETTRFSGSDYRVEHAAWKAGSVPPQPEEGKVTWVNMEGLHDPVALEAVGKAYGIHILTLEDVLNAEHRPKFEDHDDYLSVILPVIRVGEGGDMERQNITLILREGMVVSFWQGGGDFFQPVRERLKNPKRKIRTMGPGFLFYAFVDLVVDHYVAALEEVGERVTLLQEEAFRTGNLADPARLGRFRSELLEVRRRIRPVKELISSMLRSDSDLLEDEVEPFLRDVADHVASVVESLDGSLEMIRNMFDFHLSTSSMKMNEIMKFLTIISTIFIPIGFIAGFYGMNFKAMPELEWEYGYPMAMGAMASVAGGLLAYFRKRRWI